MTVAGILGVLAAIAFPAISELAATRAASTEVNKVKTVLDGARDRAHQTLHCIHLTRTAVDQLQLEELASTPSGCGTTVITTTTEQFNTNAVEITTNIDLTFNRAGGLDGVTDDYVELTISGKRRGYPNVPNTFRVYRVLGLVRRM